MAFSREFKALLRIAGFFAGTWAVVGAAIGALFGSGATGEPSVAAALRFALMYATAGGIAGMTTAWLAARAETGRQLREIPTWRLAAWGVIGGVAPAAMFGFLALVAGAPVSGVLPLIGLGILGGVVSGVVAGTASAAAKRLPSRAKGRGGAGSEHGALRSLRTPLMLPIVLSASSTMGVAVSVDDQRADPRGVHHRRDGTVGSTGLTVQSCGPWRRHDASLV